MRFLMYLGFLIGCFYIGQWLGVLINNLRRSRSRRTPEQPTELDEQWAIENEYKAAARELQIIHEGLLRDWDEAFEAATGITPYWSAVQLGPEKYVVNSLKPDPSLFADSVMPLSYYFNHISQKEIKNNYITQAMLEAQMNMRRDGQ